MRACTIFLLSFLFWSYILASTTIPSVLSAHESKEDAFLIPYRTLYHGAFRGHPLFFFLLVSCLVSLCFYLMYILADRHLSWSLEHLSKFCRLTPDMAGLTFLAFGNGAPDFFTAVFGAGKAPDLILGSSVGSGLFVICVVLGIVILLSGSDEAKLQIRAIEEGRILGDRKAATTILPNGTLPVLSKTSKRILSEPKLQPGPFLRNAFLYLVCVLFLTLFAVKRQVPFWQPCMLILLYLMYISTSVGIHYYQELQMKKATRRISLGGRSKSHTSCTSTNVDQTTMQLHESEAFVELEELPLYHRILAAILRVSWTFAERTGVVPLDLIILLLKIPIEVPFNLTIMPVEDVLDAVTCAPHLAALRFVHRLRALACPWGAFFLAGITLSPSTLLFSWKWWTAYLLLSVASTAFFFFTTSNRAKPLVYPVHVLMAFASCVLWIYLISSELVSCLEATGHLAGISPTILGIVVLAWGNSFGDLVSNVAMAKNGHVEMAISACFCGPIQNVLLTIGTSFVIATAKSPNRLLQISALQTNDIYLALGMLLAALLIIMVAVIGFGQFRVPKWLGWVLLGGYLVYLPLAAIGGLGIFSLRFPSPSR